MGCRGLLGRAGALAAICVATAACGSSEQTSGSSSGGAAGHGGAGGSGGSAGTGGGTLEASLPQAVDGALLVNPDVYTTVPLHVVSKSATSVQVTLGDQSVSATADGSGRFTAQLSVGTLAEGTLHLEATAAAGGATATAGADLVVSKHGAQLTDWNQVHTAGTPRLHRVGDSIYATWTDRRDQTDKAWMQKIDGAGRWVDARVELAAASDDVLYARTAFAPSSVGVLYQTPGGPYTNHFKIVGMDGSDVMAPIDLDAKGMYGSFGGQIVVDGTDFVMVWRDNDGAGGGQVMWARAPAAGGTLVGPKVVAASGDGTVIGGFEPFSFVSVGTVGDISLVGFVRGRYDALLDQVVPKSQYATLDHDGNVKQIDYAGIESDFTWHREARVFDVGGQLLPVWSASDLNDPSPNPANLFYAAKTDASGTLDPNRGAGTKLFVAVDDRDEPYLIPHPDHLGVMLWIDHRAYTLDPANGHISLYVAPVESDLSTGAPVVFEHARVFAGLGQLRAVPADTNALLCWVDQRHSNGITDPRPELWFDTAWY